MLTVRVSLPSAACELISGLNIFAPLIGHLPFGMRTAFRSAHSHWWRACTSYRRMAFFDAPLYVHIVHVHGIALHELYMPFSPFRMSSGLSCTLMNGFWPLRVLGICVYPFRPFQTFTLAVDAFELQSWKHHLK